ncbi:hypothetical protein C8F04DRAFT_1187961 [Mycena alexandri]|uniref:Uncharacterized protein n=1 Tax=Mycena alexandri TaxID=1745969 RepID=A0AAD6WYB8_9AGAR|nr:hypothetical protein C8F04DRAFT_1187961 [Mycena alexandri]
MSSKKSKKSTTTKTSSSKRKLTSSPTKKAQAAARTSVKKNALAEKNVYDDQEQGDDTGLRPRSSREKKLTVDKLTRDSLKIQYNPAKKHNFPQIPADSPLRPQAPLPKKSIPLPLSSPSYRGGSPPPKSQRYRSSSPADSLPTPRRRRRVPAHKATVWDSDEVDGFEQGKKGLPTVEEKDEDMDMDLLSEEQCRCRDLHALHEEFDAALYGSNDESEEVGKQLNNGQDDHQSQSGEDERSQDGEDDGEDDTGGKLPPAVPGNCSQITGISNISALSSGYFQAPEITGRSCTFLRSAVAGNHPQIERRSRYLLAICGHRRSKVCRHRRSPGMRRIAVQDIKKIYTPGHLPLCKGNKSKKLQSLGYAAQRKDVNVRCMHAARSTDQSTSHVCNISTNSITTSHTLTPTATALTAVGPSLASSSPAPPPLERGARLCGAEKRGLMNGLLAPDEDTMPGIIGYLPRTTLPLPPAPPSQMRAVSPIPHEKSAVAQKSEEKKQKEEPQARSTRRRRCTHAYTPPASATYDDDAGMHQARSTPQESRALPIVHQHHHPHRALPHTRKNKSKKKPPSMPYQTTMTHAARQNTAPTSTAYNDNTSSAVHNA